MSHNKWKELFNRNLAKQRRNRTVVHSYEAVELSHHAKMEFIRAFSVKLGDADWCRANNLLLQRIIND